IRSEINIKPGERISVLIGEANPRVRGVYEANKDQIERLARVSNLSIKAKLDAPKASVRAVLSSFGEVAVPLEGLIDFDQERVRLTKKKESLEKEAAKLETHLWNSDFLARAPAEKVSELKARAAEIELHTVALDQMIEALL